MHSGCLKGLVSSSILLAVILFWHSALLRTRREQDTRSRANPFSGAKHPFRSSLEDLSSLSGGVDFPSLLAGSFPEPHCHKRLVLLVLVTSSPGHFGPRQVIRGTWAAEETWTPFPWQSVFLLGQTSDDSVAQEIQKEQQRFGDVLVGNYLDTYRNLTLKVMHGLKWATERCRPEYILKTHDDCFVNGDRLPAFLAEHNTIKTGLYVGAVLPRPKRRVIREPSSNWYVSRQDYQPEEYPPYATSTGYVLSLDAASDILRVAERTRPILAEDAFVGILARKAGIWVKASGRFARYNAKWRVCNYRYLMVIHQLSAKGQTLAKVNMLKARTACEDSREVIRW
ncbi:beta-1,3-galactosyltransferase 5-like [Rhinatrema bivittatum]|uniref:beta-1,3-galactosyltransferase 5-like n=1 Tax=Rhinatrema bivittatum TaxID=194408 RepID=UPI00112AC789|nr:beta-1,3-galactosyltransferase 5-like [Rhinatrema bivittatum]